MQASLWMEEHTEDLTGRLTVHTPEGERTQKKPHLLYVTLVPDLQPLETQAINSCWLNYVVCSVVS